MLRTDERNQNLFVYNNDMGGNRHTEDSIDTEGLSGPIVLLGHRDPSSPSVLNHGILFDERRESHTRAVPMSDWLEGSSGGVKSAHMELQANQNSSFFPSASNFEVVGSQFNSFRDQISTGNVFINVHPGSTDTVSVHPRSDKVEISHLKGPMPIRKSSEIYYRHLLTLGHGSPLWIPEPSNTLPIEYQKAGIGIGDVGILKDSGGFDFLFNLYQPHNDPNHPINPREMPAGFWPLDLPDKRDVDSHTVFKRWSCLTSSHVHSHQDGSSYGGFVFESSAEDGAILTMPNGANSMDLDNMATIRKYVSMNVKEWYMYAKEVRGRNARNGDLRLVIGKTSATTWGMATFTNEAVLGEGAASCLKFTSMSRNIRDSTSPGYTWEYSGKAEVKAGPDEQEVEKLREFDRLKGEDGQIEYQNQCLFVRTINVMLGDAVHQASHDWHAPQRFEDTEKKIVLSQPRHLPRDPRPIKMRRPSWSPDVTSPWDDNDSLSVDASSQPDHRPGFSSSPWGRNNVSVCHDGNQRGVELAPVFQQSKEEEIEPEPPEQTHRRSVLIEDPDDEERQPPDQWYTVSPSLPETPKSTSVRSRYQHVPDALFNGFSDEPSPGANSIPTFLSQRRAPSRNDVFPSSPFMTPLKEQSLSDEDEEQVIYPTIRPRIPYTNLIDSYEQETDWITCPVPEIRMLIEDDEEHDPGQEVDAQDEAEPEDEEPASSTSSKRFSPETFDRKEDGISPHRSRSSKSVFVESAETLPEILSRPTSDPSPAFRSPLCTEFSESEDRPAVNGVVFNRREPPASTTWEKVKNTFSQADVIVSRKLRKRRTRTDSSTIRESGSIFLDEKIDTSEDGPTTTNQTQTPPLMQSPSPSASILSLVPHAPPRGSVSSIPPPIYMASDEIDSIRSAVMSRLRRRAVQEASWIPRPDDTFNVTGLGIGIDQESLGGPQDYIRAHWGGQSLWKKAGNTVLKAATRAETPLPAHNRLPQASATNLEDSLSSSGEPRVNHTHLEDVSLSTSTSIDSDSDSTSTQPWAARRMIGGSRRPSYSPSPPNSDADFARVDGQPLNRDLHPSRIINEFLLRSVPGARMAITEDRDWISVLRESDQVFPSDDVLLSRIMDMYVVCEEEGVVFLQRGRGRGGAI